MDAGCAAPKEDRARPGAPEVSAQRAVGGLPVCDRDDPEDRVPLSVYACELVLRERLLERRSSSSHSAVTVRFRPSDSASDRTLLLRRDRATISSLIAMNRSSAAAAPRRRPPDGASTAVLRGRSRRCFRCGHRSPSASSPHRPAPRCAAPGGPESRAAPTRSFAAASSAAGRPSRAHNRGLERGAERVGSFLRRAERQRWALRLVFSAASGRISSSSLRYSSKRARERLEMTQIVARSRATARIGRSACDVALDRLSRPLASSAAAADASSVSAITARFDASAALVNSTCSSDASRRASTSWVSGRRGPAAGCAETTAASAITMTSVVRRRNILGPL